MYRLCFIDAQILDPATIFDCHYFLFTAMMSSTLVETVSINYEDFNDSFLTCGTCLCVYDGSEHHPKLLPCSHTVCKNCLERIVDTQIHDTGTFRCPICRETIGNTASQIAPKQSMVYVSLMVSNSLKLPSTTLTSHSLSVLVLSKPWLGELFMQDATWFEFAPVLNIILL